MKAEKQRTIAAGEIKAHCLALLDEVNATGEEIVITKRGKPVARICPLPPEPDTLDWRSLKGTVTFLGDVVSPIDEGWDILKGSVVTHGDIVGPLDAKDWGSLV